MSHPLGRTPVSVFIIARNEADRIGRTIDSVRFWADEVVVIDSGSSDGTQAAAEARGARVVFHEWAGYGPQKAFGERECRNDWLLNLDADEYLSPQLALEIQALFAGAGAPAEAAFRLRWKTVHFRDAEPRALAPAKRFIRLYDRRKAGFRPSLVHDSVVVREGDVGDLSGLVLHHSFRSLQHFRDKLSAYAELQARDMHERGRKPPAWRAATEAPLAFVKLYLARRYCIYGADGLAMARAYAVARRARIEKARALFAAPAGET